LHEHYCAKGREAVEFGVQFSRNVLVEELLHGASGAVYIVDRREMTTSDLGGSGVQAISAFDIRLHVLRVGDTFDAAARRP
jgi:cyanophycinase-like exopeptidase